jgi:hypothetical protein
MVEVTKEWLAAKVTANPSKTIGRALLAIYERNQTFQEQSATVTKLKNGIGFSKPDARIGSIGARQFRKYGRIAEWQINIWTKPDKKGYPRICKYADQLNTIAQAKAISSTL